MNISLNGKRALVTGANSGIGEAIALAFGAAGADVAVNYVAKPEDAQAVVEKLKSGGSRAMAVEADVADPEQVSAMFAQLEEAWSGLDILVNNAGIDGAREPAWEADLEEWRKVIDINLFGAFSCSQEALKRMVPRGSGVILNLSSVHEIIPWSGYSAYAAAKAGVSMLTKTLSQEASPFGVRVLALAPGAIKTSINRSVWSDPAMREDLLQKIPLNRIGEVSDVANMAVVLVSDVAGYVTGTTVFVDGGMTDYPDFAHGG